MNARRAPTDAPITPTTQPIESPTNPIIQSSHSPTKPHVQPRESAAKPRIAPVAPPYADRLTEDFAALMPPGMEPLGLFRTLAQNPRVLRRVRRGGLLDPGSISLRQRELVILRTTALAHAEYEWGVHAAFFASAAGLDATQLRASVWLGPDAPCWSADESALLAACDALHTDARIDDATWARLAEHFAPAQLIEVLVLAGFYRTISYVVNGSGVALEPAAPRFPPAP